MNILLKFYVFVFMLICVNTNITVVHAQIITTIAGTGITGNTGDGGMATDALLNWVWGVAVDKKGNIFIADQRDFKIRKINTSGIISTFAGNGTWGNIGDGGAATNAQLANVQNIITDKIGNVYIADSNVVRKVDTFGIITTIAGIGAAGYTGDGGQATLATLNRVVNVAFDLKGNLYIVDAQNHCIRKVDTFGIITTVAGNGTAGYSGNDSQATNAQLNAPQSIAIDKSGNMYIAEFYNFCVRKVDTAGIITTIAGNGTLGYSGDRYLATAALLDKPVGIAIDTAGNIFVADGNNQRIRKINGSGFLSGHINTIAGNGVLGYNGDSILATMAKLYYPKNIAFDDKGNLYIADLSNHRIRKVSAPLPDILGTPTVCLHATTSLGDTISGGNWSSSDTTIASVDSLTGVVTGMAVGMATITYYYSGSLAAITITVNPLPNAGIITGADSLCIATTILLTDTITDGIWLTTNANAIDTLGYITGNMAGLDTIQYIVFNSCGVDTALKYITILPQPNAGIIAGANLCMGATLTFTDSLAGGIWSSVNGYAVVNTSGMVTGITKGIDTVYYKITNTCGVDSVSFAFLVDTFPVIALITGDTALCINTTTTLKDSILGGAWSSLYGKTTTTTYDSGVVLTALTLGRDTIVYTITNSCGSVNKKQGIRVDTNRSAGSITCVQDTVCQASNITLIDTVLGGYWVATNSNGILTGGVGQVTGVVAGIDTIQYIVNNGCGADTAIKIVKVLPLPVQGVITGYNVCEGASQTFVPSASGGIWTISNANAIISATGVVTGIALGMDTITYTVTNSCGFAFATKTISIDSLPFVAPIAGYNRVCVGGTDTLADSILGGNWAEITGLSSVSPFDSGAVLGGISAGADTIIYTITNSCGQISAKLAIRVDTFPVAGTIIAVDSVCEGSSIVVKDTVSPTMGIGVWSVSNSHASVLPGLIHGLVAGIDTIIYTITNSCGSAQTQKPVSINPAPNAGIIFGLDTICQGSTVTFTDTTANAKGVWNVGNMSADSTSTVIAATAIGIFNITYKIHNICGTKTANKSTDVISKPNSLITTGVPNVCLGSSIQLSNYVKGGVWNSKNNNASIISDKGIVTGLALGRDTIIYIVTNSCGADTDYYTETINPNPITPVITQKENLLTVDTGYNTYQWTLNGLPIPGAVFDTYTVNTTGVYEIEVSNIFGCSVTSAFRDDTAIAPCQVKDLLIFPNPTTSILNLRWCAYLNIRLMTMEGKTIFTQIHPREIDLTGLPNGTYMLLITDDKDNKILGKVISKITN